MAPAEHLKFSFVTCMHAPHTHMRAHAHSYTKFHGVMCHLEDYHIQNTGSNS